jgi:hypothetical protein
MYSTDGYIRCVKSFIKSFKRYHNEDIKIILTLRNVSQSEIEKLHAMYNNLHIFNNDIDYHQVATDLGISVEEYKRSKRVFEFRDTTPRDFGKHNLLYKQYISVNDRYRNSIKEAFSVCKEDDLLIHFDADTIIKANISGMIKYMKRYDVCIKFRHKAVLRSKVLGSLISFKVNKKSNNFLDTWVKHIDAVLLHNRPKKYGQTSFYYTYADLKNNMKFGDLSQFDHLIEKSYKGVS